MIRIIAEYIADKIMTGTIDLAWILLYVSQPYVHNYLIKIFLFIHCQSNFICVCACKY